MSLLMLVVDRLQDNAALRPAVAGASLCDILSQTSIGMATPSSILAHVALVSQAKRAESLGVIRCENDGESS